MSRAAQTRPDDAPSTRLATLAALALTLALGGCEGTTGTVGPGPGPEAVSAVSDEGSSVDPSLQGQGTDSWFSAVDPAGLELDPEIGDLLEGAFSFLPRLPVTATEGTLDPGLLADLSVEICLPDRCGTSAVALFDATTGPGAETLRFDAKGPHFIVNWDTRSLQSGAGEIHRIRVLAAGLEIGSADVLLVGQGQRVPSDATGSTLELRDGQTLPVKFEVMRNRVIAAWVLAADGTSAPEVAARLISEFGSPADEVVALLDFAGFAPGEIAAALRVEFGLTATATTTRLQAAGLVSDAATAATALLQGGYGLVDVIEVLLGLFPETPESVATIFFELGESAADVGDGLRTVAGLGLPETTVALRSGGYGAGDVGAWLLTEPEAPDATAVSILLADAGYGLAEVAAFLEGTGVVALTDVVTALLGAGFGVADIATWITERDGGTESEAAAVLASLGQPAAEVGDWLLSRGLTDPAVVQVLKDAGFTADPTGTWLVDVVGRSEEEAGALLTDVGHAAADIGDWLVDRFIALGDVPERALEKATGILKNSGLVLGDLGDWVLDKAGRIDDVAGRVFKAAGYKAGDVAEYFGTTLGRAVDKVGGILANAGYTAEETARALRMELGARMRQITGVLKNAFGFGSRTASGILRDLGASAAEVGDAVQAEFAEGIEQTAETLGYWGYQAQEAGDWLLDWFGSSPDPLAEATGTLGGGGFDFESVADWVVAQVGGDPGNDPDTLLRVFLVLNTYDPNNDARAAEYLVNGLNVALAELGGVLDAAGRSAEEIVDLLAGVGAEAEEIAEILVGQLGAGLDQVAALLKAKGFTPGAVFDALYNVAKTLEGAAADPIGFGLRVTFAAMDGAGYFLRDLTEHIRNGTFEWLEGALADALIDLPESFTIAEMSEFLVAVGDLTVQRMLERALAAGFPVDEVIEGLAAAGVAIGTIVDRAEAVYGLTLEQMAQATKDAGLAVEAFGDALIGVYGATEEAVAEALRDAGFALEQTAQWLIGRSVGTAEAVLGRVVGILEKTGYAFEDVAAWTWDRSVAIGGAVVDRTAGILISAGYIPRKVAGFLLNTAGQTKRKVFGALENAGVAASEAADALIEAGDATFTEVGAWLAEFYESDVAETIQILFDLRADLIDLVAVMRETFDATIDQVLALLGAYDYSETAILTALGG